MKKWQNLRRNTQTNLPKCKILKGGKLMESVNMSSFEMNKAEQLRGKGAGFDRIRRITGYLVGTLDRFGSGKRAEEKDRVKHGVSQQ